MKGKGEVVRVVDSDYPWIFNGSLGISQLLGIEHRKLLNELKIDTGRAFKEAQPAFLRLKTTACPFEHVAGEQSWSARTGERFILPNPVFRSDAQASTNFFRKYHLQRGDAKVGTGVWSFRESSGLGDLMATLTEHIQEFLSRTVPGLYARFLPTGEIPRILAGYRTFPGTWGACLDLLASLHAFGMTEINGRPIEDLAAGVLKSVQGRECKSWWSYFLIKGIQAFGPLWDVNPLIARLSSDERRFLREAVNTSAIVDIANERLIGHPNNYWLVVALCEKARVEAGIQDDKTFYELAVRKTCEVFLETEEGFLDDDHERRGRYDMYLYHLHSIEPLFPQFPAEKTARAVERIRELYLATTHPNGSGIQWGRSNGAAGISEVLRVGTFLLRYPHEASREAIYQHLATTIQSATTDWWAEDALCAHRYRSPHWYMGPGRILERSMLFLTALARTGIELNRLPQHQMSGQVGRLSSRAYPEQDTWIPFDTQGAGVWSVRKGRLASQLPLVEGYTSDYVAAPVYAGLFEQVVDKGMPCGVPVVDFGRTRYLPLHHPVDVEKGSGYLKWTTPSWTNCIDWDWWKGAEDRNGRRSVEARIDGESLNVEEYWEFDEIPTGLGIWFAESVTPLMVDWIRCSSPFVPATIEVSGMKDWRSHFHEIKAVHQIDIEPSETVILS